MGDHVGSLGQSRSMGESPDGRPVIAVLPFEDLSGQDLPEWLVATFSEEVINRVNDHPDLVAMNSHTSGHALFRESIVNGEFSGYVIHGKLLPAPVGTRVRVSLTNPSGIVEWEHEQVSNFRESKAAQNAQAWIAGQIAAAMGKELTGNSYCALSDMPKANELFFKAQDLFSRRGAANVAQAALALEEAIAIDTEFARGMELLSEVYKRFARWVSEDPSQYGMTAEELRDFLQRTPERAPAISALSLCPTLGAAWYNVEISEPVAHTIADAVELLDEAIRRDPGNQDLMSRMMEFLNWMGHIDRAHDLATEIYIRNPLSTRAPHLLGWAERLQGNLQLSADLELEAVSLGYELSNIRPLLASTFVILGNAAALDAILDDPFVPDDRIPIDPRDVLKSQQDPQLRQELIEAFEAVLAEGKPSTVAELASLTGPSLLMDLGDRNLAWQAIDRFQELVGGYNVSFWDPQYRRWFGNERMMNLPLRELWVDFWDRFGAPDGCDWDGENLDCSWADSN